VVILGRALRLPVEAPGRPDALLSRVLRESPRPTVIVPSDPASGAGVLVAYGSGREVARTLQTFTLLGVALDEAVGLLAIEPDRARTEARLQPAGQFLAAHGVHVTLQPVATEEAPAAVILDQVRRQRPRLLVMGAHGHHPVRDLFFTSVMRAVLRDAPVPVFVGA
jgi:nucleotide-binding universal stress UspA family protein